MSGVLLISFYRLDTHFRGTINNKYVGLMSFLHATRVDTCHWKRNSGKEKEHCEHWALETELFQLNKTCERENERREREKEREGERERGREWERERRERGRERERERRERQRDRVCVCEATPTQFPQHLRTMNWRYTMLYHARSFLNARAFDLLFKFIHE